METSRQYSFINNQHGFTVSVIDGAELMDELSKIHNIGPHAIDFYRKSVLSSLQMINFIKPQESLGFYIDSEDPYYRFKIEISQSGSLRTLLLPEEFDAFPNTLTGKTRIVKVMPGRDPYTSILEFSNHPIENLVNEVMEQSYQSKSKILIAPGQTTSLMLTKLPPSNVDKKIENYDDLPLGEIEAKYAELIKKVLHMSSTTVEELNNVFTAESLNYIGSKPVNFHCPCSRDRMIENLFTLPVSDREEIFSEQDSIEIRCDYCNTIYTIPKNEIIQDLQ